MDEKVERIPQQRQRMDQRQLVILTNYISLHPNFPLGCLDWNEIIKMLNDNGKKLPNDDWLKKAAEVQKIITECFGNRNTGINIHKRGEISQRRNDSRSFRSGIQLPKICHNRLCFTFAKTPQSLTQLKGADNRTNLEVDEENVNTQQSPNVGGGMPIGSTPRSSTQFTGQRTPTPTSVDKKFTKNLESVMKNLSLSENTPENSPGPSSEGRIQNTQRQQIETSTEQIIEELKPVMMQLIEGIVQLLSKFPDRP